MTAARRIDVVAIDTIDSTQAEAKRRIALTRADAQLDQFRASLLMTAEQTGGIGRFGRSWSSPRGGLWATLSVPFARCDRDLASHIEGMGLRVGVACLEFVHELVPLAARSRVQLKWPNDVVLDGRKLLGVLCEVVRTPTVDWIIIGVGLNANLDVEELPDNLRARSTTLRTVFQLEIDLGGAAVELATRLSRAADECGIPEQTLAIARSSLYGVHQRMPVSLPGGEKVLATFVAIDSRGEAIFDQEGSRWIAPQSIQLDG